MNVITEGVSSREHVEFLRNAGCDIFQGYYYSMPITVEEFEKRYELEKM
jgi:EAL domain-containing protein (putative c-di-GMP-specific phosphodiesterase class I)